MRRAPVFYPIFTSRRIPVTSSNLPTTNTQLNLQTAIRAFESLDLHHSEDSPRLLMTRWGEDGIRELQAIIRQRDLAYRDHECPQCCTLENLPDYDEVRGGFIDPHDPSVIHDPASWAGQQQLAAHVRECYEPFAYSEFTEALEHFESGTDLPDDVNTTGCAAYWINVWLAPESELNSDPRRIEANTAKLLGMDPTQIAALVACEEQLPLHLHARPVHVAAILKMFLQTGVVSWNNIVPDCSDHDCSACYPHHEYCGFPECPEFD